jgi:hypothetical protein
MCYRNLIRYSCNHVTWHFVVPFTLCGAAPNTYPIQRLCENVRSRIVHVSAYQCSACVPQMYDVYGSYMGGSGGTRDNIPQ